MELPMPGLMVNHGAPAPRQLTREEDAQRIEGLRILARIIVHHHHARHARSFRREDCERDAARDICDGSRASARPSLNGDAA